MYLWLLYRLIKTIIFLGVVLYLCIPESNPQPYTLVKDSSGIKHIYHLPDGMAFTVWEKEPGVYGSEVFIIPADYRDKKEPNVSYIKVKYGAETPYLYYSLFKPADRTTFLKNRIVVKKGTDSENETQYQIVNVRGSKWEILNYSSEYYHYLFYSPHPADSVKVWYKEDASFFKVNIDSNSADFRLGKPLEVRPSS